MEHLNQLQLISFVLSLIFGLLGALFAVYVSLFFHLKIELFLISFNANRRKEN